jgi:hypothetical protein
MARPARSVVVVAVLVIALVIASVIAVLAFAPSVSHFAPNSPEDVFQRYLKTYQDRDFTAAYEFFSAEARQQLSRDDYVSYARSGFDFPQSNVSRVAISRVEGGGANKTLHVTIEHQSGSGLDLNNWSEDLVIPMVQESGGWKIDRLLLGTSSAPVAPITK